jgi:hypothetical protein
VTRPGVRRRHGDAIGLPLRRTGHLAGAFGETWFANVMGLAVLSLVLPWGHLVRTDLRAPGDRWSPRAATAAAVRAGIPKA